MRPALVLLALCAVTWTTRARAADAGQLQFAAEEHDLGYRAYVAKSFDEAASHFENAFFAAPNPAELRSAIRARREAGQLARAATLAAIGERRYPGDEALSKFIAETIALAKPKVFEVKVLSPVECAVAVDDRVKLSEKAREARFFVEPGKHELLVGWSNDQTKRLAIEATAGGIETFTVDPPPPPEVAAPPRPIAPEPAPSVLSTPASAPPHDKPLGPIWFIAGTALTVIGGGATLWSGLDAEKNPGTAAVRADCVGPWQGQSCPLYQEGLHAQLRTNILAGVTAAVGITTLGIGLFGTQWSHVDRAPATGLHLEPALGLGQAALKGTF